MRVAFAALATTISLIAKDALAFPFMPHSKGISHSYVSKSTQMMASIPDIDTETDLQGVLEKLEKRIKNGVGSLSPEEVSDMEAAITRIVAQINTATDNGVVTSESTSAALPLVFSDEQYGQLRSAVSSMDINTVSNMLKSGMSMDEATTELAFWATVNAIDHAEANDKAIPASVPQMIHHIFEADLEHLLTREKQTTNVTCMQPDDGTGIEGAARKMNYIFDDSAHKDLPLMQGRKCEDGNCCDKCSRNIFPTFASDKETSREIFPELSTLTFNGVEKVKSATILQFVRLVERVRRTIAHEYGLPLKTILPLQAYSRKYVAGTTQKGGGGGEGDFVTLHTDEATHSGYHYSCVLYLSTQGVDFEGGNFVFNDPAPDADTNTDTDMDMDTDANKKKVNNVLDDNDDDDDISDDLLQRLMNGLELPDDNECAYEDTKDFIDNKCIDDDEEEVDDDYYNSLMDGVRGEGRIFTPFHPTRGAAVIFSSGWENMHEVEKITSGVRYAVPCFFTTCPVPEAAYEQMAVGKPKTNEDIADDWLHLLMAHREESAMESAGRVRELLMKWHYMCAPLDQH